MFRVKICGVTNRDDALLAVDAGAEAIGINFYSHSPRFTPREQAADIVAAIGKRALKVGVFVDASVEEVAESFESLGLDLVQLHGDEPPGTLQALGDMPVIRAFRCRTGLASIAAYLEACRVLGCPPRMVLIDSYDPAQYGGSGQVAPWEVISKYRDLRFPYPLVLAGGLTAENVGAAIERVVPAAVDVSSGVEQAPGKKDPERLRSFINRAVEAFSLAAARS